MGTLICLNKTLDATQNECFLHTIKIQKCLLNNNKNIHRKTINHNALPPRAFDLVLSLILSLFYSIVSHCPLKIKINHHIKSNIFTNFRESSVYCKVVSS